MAKKKITESTWNSISGTMRVYTNELEGKGGKPWYKSSVSIASKDSDDNYHRFYIDLKFGKKAEEPEGEGVHILDIEEAFLTTEYWTDKKTKEERVKPVLMVTSCEVVE